MVDYTCPYYDEDCAHIDCDFCEFNPRLQDKDDYPYLPDHSIFEDDFDDDDEDYDDD